MKLHENPYQGAAYMSSEENLTLASADDRLFFNSLVESAKNIFTHDGKVAPFCLVENKDGVHFVPAIEFSNEEDQKAYARIIQALSATYNATRIGLVCESRTLIVRSDEEHQAILKDGKERVARGERPLESNPDAKDVIFVQVESDLGRLTTFIPTAMAPTGDRYIPLHDSLRISYNSFGSDAWKFESQNSLMSMLLLPEPVRTNSEVIDKAHKLLNDNYRIEIKPSAEFAQELEKMPKDVPKRTLN